MEEKCEAEKKVQKAEVLFVSDRNPGRRVSGAGRYSGSSESGTETGRDKTGEEKPEKGVTVEEKSETDEYGRDGDQYTNAEAQDVFSRVKVSVTNEEELERVVGVSIDRVKRFLNIYASHNGIEAQTVTMLDYVFAGELAERMKIYMQYDDPDQTLVTVLFEPANANHSSHVDVLPCQYSLKEIQKQVWQ